VIAQRPQQRRVGIDVQGVRLAVYLEFRHGEPPACMKGKREILLFSVLMSMIRSTS
jgi:hypothetical protein